MSDRPFKSMAREGPKLHWWDFGYRPLKTTECEACAGTYGEGDWPFCKGNPEDHKR